MSKFIEANEKIAEKVTGGYKKIGNGVVEGYKKIEHGTVEGFNKVSDRIIEKVFSKDVRLNGTGTNLSLPSFAKTLCSYLFHSVNFERKSNTSFLLVWKICGP